VAISQPQCDIHSGTSEANMVDVTDEFVVVDASELRELLAVLDADAREIFLTEIGLCNV
jgi:hypothetical protein